MLRLAGMKSVIAADRDGKVEKLIMLVVGHFDYGMYLLRGGAPQRLQRKVALVATAFGLTRIIVPPAPPCVTNGCPRKR